jgi:aspartate dehydrogenase
MLPRKVGIIGFGKVGQYLADAVLRNPRSQNLLELAFVCDSFAPNTLANSSVVPDELKTYNIDTIEEFKADLIVEVAHPSITKLHGPRLLKSADYYVASTTAFADINTEFAMMQEADRSSGKAIYASVGALFGAHDIQKMDASGKLDQLSIKMTKHPDSFMPVVGTKEYELNESAKFSKKPIELFRGSVRDIAKVFPVNVNTMATAALAGSRTVGFDQTEAVIVADSTLETMIIEVDMRGAPTDNGNPGLVVQSRRENPSVRGEVTGPATMISFYASLLNVAKSGGGQDGIHLV